MGTANNKAVKQLLSDPRLAYAMHKSNSETIVR